jgi:hypothetical protein
MSRALGLLAAVALGCVLSGLSSAQEALKRTVPVKAVTKVQDAPAVDAVPVQEPAEPIAPTLPAAGGFIMRNGEVVGQVATVEGSGTLVPLPFATVTFMQNRRFVAQGRTNRNGQFSVRGLTPSAVYSVIVTSRDSIAIVGAVVREAAGGASASNVKNEIRLVANRQQFASLKQAGDSMIVQAIPRDDFFAALQGGLFGDPGSMGPGGGGVPGGLGGGGGGAGGGSGGGSGGGGGGGGGLGGLLAGAAGAIGFAAAASEGFGDDDAASPFGP